VHKNIGIDLIIGCAIVTTPDVTLSRLNRIYRIEVYLFVEFIYNFTNTGSSQPFCKKMHLSMYSLLHYLAQIIMLFSDTQ